MADTIPMQEDLIHQQIEAAARTLAECMDYPWQEMPEAGKRSMRAHAIKIIHAAFAAAEPVAFCEPDDPNPGEAFSWPGNARRAHHTMPLYAYLGNQKARDS